MKTLQLKIFGVISDWNKELEIFPNSTSPEVGFTLRLTYNNGKEEIKTNITEVHYFYDTRTDNIIGKYRKDILEKEKIYNKNWTITQRNPTFPNEEDYGKFFNISFESMYSKKTGSINLIKLKSVSIE